MRPRPLHAELYFATFRAEGCTAMHEWGDRVRGRGYDSDGGTGERDVGKPRTPDDEATARVYRVWQEVESVATRVEQLSAIVGRDEWRTERNQLQQAHDTLVENVTARELDANASARAREHYTNATKKLGDIATTLSNAHEPRRPVPPVAGEEAIELSIIARSAAPEDVLAWVSGLDARDRRAIVSRLDAVRGGSVDRTDGFAVSLANYFGDLAVRKKFPDLRSKFLKTAENPRHFDRAEYLKSRAPANATTDPGTHSTIDADRAAIKLPAARPAAPVQAQESRGTTESKQEAGTPPHALRVVSLDDSPADLASEPDPPDVSTRKGGPLPYRQEMERSFGRSFANIEAHTGMAAELEPLGAQAITVGHVVAFADAQPSPALVAHEATHAVQNEQAGTSSAMASGGVMSAHSQAEVEADAMAERVAQHGAGVRLPPVAQTPTGRIARSVRPRNAPPPPPPLYSAGAWLDHMLVASPLRIEVINHLATAKLSTGHPRFTWTPASSLPVRVLGAVGNAARLQLVLAPFDILARIDQVRELGDAKGKANVGPLTYVPEVAPILARELEIAIDRCVQRLVPRLVAAFDATVASAGAPATRDASTVSPDALVFSHPLDRIVDDLIREGSLATIRPRKPDDAEPDPDRTAPSTLRAVTYRWAEDPALWNWIRVEPPDAKPEEVAKHVLGTTTRAYELHGAAPYYALPPSHVQTVAPDRAAAFRVISTAHPAAQQADELSHGVSPTALARSKVGETAGLAQAEQAADHSRGAQKDGDAGTLAERCRLQGHLIVDTYPELGAASKLAPMAARLADRTRRLSTLPAADYARFGKLFAQQSSVLYVVAGDLETIANQAKRLQHASATKAIDPTLAGIADLVLDAAACSDLPETAHKQLELAHAKHAAIPFDAMDAMLDDARARTMATDALAAEWGPGDSGSTKTSPPMTGRQQWEDLRAREKRLSGDVLTARRARIAATDKAGATRVLTERTRALQIEARLVAAETQCGYMSDKLEEQEGIVATIAGQMRDLQRARRGLQALANTMAGIRIRWREKHAQLFALVESGAGADGDPAMVIRQAIAELEAELAQVGDEKTKAALETAQSELKDIAVARAVADIAIMIGLTLTTSGLGAAAGGAARGLGMGRTAAQLVNVATQSVAMATLRTMLYHDSFSSAFGSELLTNFAGLAALRGVAMGLSKLKFGKSLAILKQGEGAWKYIAHGTELTIEAATQAGIQFAIAEAESIVRQGRTLNDDELKMLAIQGIGMFVGNAIAHRLATPALDALGAYAARIGAPYRRAQVRRLADRVARTGDPQASKELIRAERALVAEELALLQRIANDPAEHAQFGEKTLATVTEQARGHAVAVTELGVEHALQHGLSEISPGKAWEGSTGRVEHALAEVRAQGALVHAEQLADGTRRHTVTAGAKQYTVYEQSPSTPRPPRPSFTAEEIAIQQAFLPAGGISGQAIRELATVPRLDPATLANLVARGPAAAEVVAQALLKVAHWPDAARTGLVKLAAHGSTDAMRVYAKVLTSLQIDGMTAWVTLASRELHNPDQILNLERSLDKGIEMHRLDPTTAMEVDYYKGKRITRAERDAERATPEFDKKQHTNIDLENSTERREMKRVNPVITASDKFTGQIGEGVGKLRDARQPSLKRGGTKKNIVDVDFGNRLQIPGADQAWIENRVRRYIRANGDAAQYVDTFIIHVELSGSHVDIIIEVP
jgi:hypothetical protein